jgi:hypothetical protein
VAGLRRGAPLLALLVLAGCGRMQWREVDARLRRVSERARQEGFAALAGRNNEFGTFTDSGTVRWSVELDPLRPYFLAAVCTEHCRGLNLTVSLPDSTLIAQDSSGAPDARVTFIAPIGGTYPVRLRLAGCASGTCRWAAQLYARGINQ